MIKKKRQRDDGVRPIIIVAIIIIFVCECVYVFILRVFLSYEHVCLFYFFFQFVKFTNKKFLYTHTRSRRAQIVYTRILHIHTLHESDLL